LNYHGCVADCLSIADDRCPVRWIDGGPLQREKEVDTAAGERGKRVDPKEEERDFLIKK
jgi:hypothetical protein